MVNQDLNYSSITNNRPGYAIPITFIGIFILIPIVTTFVDKVKELKEVDINWSSKLFLPASILLVVILCIIALFIEFNNCIRYDIQLKIGERLINLCGGTQYYQRESPEELISSMIYQADTKDLIDVNGSPLKANFVINLILNIIFYILFLIYSFIVLNRYILLILESDASTVGKIPSSPLQFWQRFKITEGIEKKVLACVIYVVLILYIVIYTLATFSENKKLGKIPKDAGKKSLKMTLIKYSSLKVGIIGFTGLMLFVATKAGWGQSKVSGSEFMQEWNKTRILGPLFAFIFGLSIIIYYYKSSYEQLPSAVNEYMNKCNTLNTNITDIIKTKITGSPNYTIAALKLRNILYKNIIDLEPNVSDPMEKTITAREKQLYQYIKHNNGKELIQLENALTTREIEDIRANMKELRNYSNIKKTFTSYNKTIFWFFAVFTVIIFYIIFNYNYKNNTSQVTLLTAISIVILIIITTIFGWFSNAVLMA